MARILVFDLLDEAKEKLEEAIEALREAAEEYELLAKQFEKRGIEKAVMFYRLKASTIRAVIKWYLEPAEKILFD